MGTEYRRGIPSVAHIEAATRLGLEWEENRSRGRSLRRWRWVVRDGSLWCDFMSDTQGWGPLEPLDRGAIVDPADAQRMEYRPIRPDGTPVDWNVLDAEVARVQGPIVGTVALLELDDVDHSQSTKLDSTPLKRGKMPTAEQIGKYREVMARRSGTAAEALKASGINSEVAQYVLDRWAGGLSDKEALWTIIVAEGSGTLASSIDRATIDERVQQARKPALDTSEPTDDSAQRQCEEQEAQRQRMAALQAQLAAERAARTVEPQPEPTRFDLLECDPKADPAVSIAAWETRQKRSIARPMPMPKPQPAPHRLFEVVDAEAEGLRPGAVFTALLCRALNPNC